MKCLLEKDISEALIIILYPLPPILLYNILDDMKFFINADTMFTLDDGDIEEL